MACRKNLLTVDYHYDDETGIYSVGEIDHGISGALGNYLEKYGKRGFEEIILALSYLTTEVTEEWRRQASDVGCCKDSKPGGLV